MVCFGDSIRGYGIGVLFELLMIGAIWDVAVRPNEMRIAAAVVVSMMAVHLLFYNAVILSAGRRAGLQ